MPAQASGGAGRNDRRHDNASKCDNCGNRHTGLCWPKCSTCGKVHKGQCRYAQSVPSNPTATASQPSPQEIAAYWQDYQTGYQRAYSEMRPFHGVRPMTGPSMGPIMAPSLGAQFPFPMGGFGNPYPVQYGGFGGIAAEGIRGWGTQMHPGQFGQPQGGLVTSPMGLTMAAPDDGTRQSSSGARPAPRSGREPRANGKQKGEAKDKRGKKDPLAPKSAGMGKPISKSAKRRARRQRKVAASFALDLEIVPANDVGDADVESVATLIGDAEDDVAVTDA